MICTAKRLRLIAQGCEATLGSGHDNPPVPRRGSAIMRTNVTVHIVLSTKQPRPFLANANIRGHGLTGNMAQPLRGSALLVRPFPRVAAQPWAMRRNRFAVEDKHLIISESVVWQLTRSDSYPLVPFQ